MRAIRAGAFLLVVAVAAALGLSGYLDEEHRLTGRFLPGVWVEGVPLDGRTVAEAVALLRPRVRARLTQPLMIRVVGSGGVRTWTVTAQGLGLRHDLFGVLERAYAVGRSGSLFERLWTRWRLRVRPAVYRIPYGVRTEVLHRWVAHIAREIHIPPTDARFVVEGDRVRVLPSRDGAVLDVPAAHRRLVRALLQGETEVELRVRTLRPRLSTAEAQALGIQEVVAEYRTWLVNIPSRTYNIALTARLLRGRLIRTGEVFSFNRAVGPRTRARGFLPAPVILRDEFVPGDGGGVCQVSSTLFNAALLADLKVLSRTPHSLPVPYLPVGRDATVVYGAIDLRFRNDGPPLLLWAEVRGQELVVRFYGRRVPGRTVEIVVTDVERLPAPEGQVVRPDPDLPEGTVKVLPPRPGFRASTWRIVRQDGRVVRRELVARSFYRPVPEILKVGTRTVEPPLTAGEGDP
jgi:vancomycin resistance protein YoaR